MSTTNPSDVAQRVLLWGTISRKMQQSASPPLAANQLGELGLLSGRNSLRAPAMVEILRFAVALVAVGSSESKDGLKKQTGGSFAGRGETLHVKLTEPAKPPLPVTVIADDPALPAVAMLMLAGFGATLNCPTIGAAGQLFTRLVALIVPIPVAKSQPVLLAKAG